jgi:hypothetical protein
MKELKDLVAGILMEKVTLDNAADIMKLGIKYKHEGMRKKALEELNKNYADN